MSKQRRQKFIAQYFKDLKENWVEYLYYYLETIAALCFFWFIMDTKSRGTTYQMFVHFNWKLLLVSFSLLMFSLVVLVGRYTSSLGFFDEETEETLQVIKSNRVIIVVLWTFWAVLGFLLFKFPFFVASRFYDLTITVSLDLETQLILSAIIILPSIMIAIWLELARWGELRRERRNPSPYGYEDERLLSGYLGLISIPIYFGLILLCCWL